MHDDVRAVKTTNARGQLVSVPKRVMIQCHSVLTALWYDNQAKVIKDRNFEWFIDFALEIKIHCFFELKIDFQT